MLRLLKRRVVLLLAGACSLSAAPSFYKDVAPILQQRCQSCHRAGEIGPMPLTTYRETRPWAKAIREAVALKRMPPWFADSRFGDFANDPSLTAAEIATVTAWVAAGAPAGSVKDAPASAKWAAGRELSNANVITAMVRPFRVAARMTIPYQSFVLPASFAADTWASAVEIRPSDRTVVHHAVLYVREPGASWLDKVPNTADILAIYTPGAPVMKCPEGMAKKIPAGSDLVLQMHYTSKATDAADKTEVAIVTSAAMPKYRMLTLQMARYDLDIPPGDREYRATVSGTMPQDSLLVSMYPHMHLRGSGFEYQIVSGTGGRVENLLKVNGYDFSWQLAYRLRQPRLLPAGTRLLFTGYFDNSAGNKRNPDPTAEVMWGEQSWEEMMVGVFQVIEPVDANSAPSNDASEKGN